VTFAVSPPSRAPQRSGYLAELWKRREFAWYMAMGRIRSRHAETYLGLVWWVLTPLLLGSVYLIVFGTIFNTARGDPNYIGFLLSGLFAFVYTSSSLNSGASSILQNARLVTTQSFPRLILPIASLVEGAAGFLFSLIPLVFIAGFAAGDWPGVYTLLLIPTFILHTLFNLGLTALVGILTIPFRDITNVLPMITRIWLYTSPVIFALDARLKNASETLYTILSFNPLVSILGMYRAAILGRELETAHVVGSIGWGIGLCVVGVAVFIRKEPSLARHL